MPLRLKSLELHGYKTFAIKTDFVFAEGITAIVGPNGSGKSNIADALRWVLGEQSYSLLRAKKTEDMIFAGSEQRTRAGMASATIVFDNADGWLPVDFSEVAVTRHAYRDGHNEYLLNGQHVRLKDIFELLAQSGLSERTYTILGQGLVDASLALKADERRRLFEEAAGIGLYRARREEALKRLESTKHNHERALDILAELEPRLKSLERQARRAQEYSQVQTDLRMLLRDWYGYHWYRAQRELGEARELVRDQEVKVHAARESNQTIREKVSTFRDRLQGLRARLNSWHRQSSQYHERRELISLDLAVRDERLRSVENNRLEMEAERSQIEAEMKMATERLIEAEAELSRLKLECEEAETQQTEAQSALSIRQAERSHAEEEMAAARYQLDELNSHRAELQARRKELAFRCEAQKQKLESAVAVIEQAETEVTQAEIDYQRMISARQIAERSAQAAEVELQTMQKNLSNLDEILKTLRLERAAKLAEQARLTAQLEVLNQAEESLAGYADGAKLLLDASRQRRLNGALGALSSSLDVPAELETAITAALGEYTDSVLLKSGEAAEDALLLLDAETSARASLLPLDWLAPGEVINVPNHPNCLGIATDLVKAPMELRPAVDLLLGQVIIVRDRKAARAILVGMPGSVRAVTLRGEVFHSSGQVLAGKPVKAASLSRPRQRRELQELLLKVDEKLTVSDASLQKLEQEILLARDAIGSCEREFHEKRAGVESARVEERQTQIRMETTVRQRDWQVSQIESLKSEITSANTEEQEASFALADIEKEIRLALETIRSRTSALAGLALDEMQAQVAYWGTRRAVVERATVDAQRNYAERNQAVTHVKEEESALGTRLLHLSTQLCIIEDEKTLLRQQEVELNARLDELRILIEPAERELETAEAQEVELQKQEADSQQLLARVERLNNQYLLEAARKQETLDLLRQKIEDDFGLVEFEYQTDVSGPVPLPFDGMVEQLNKITELPLDMEDHLTRQRSLLRRMGPVNPEAKQEYDTVKQRCDFMKEQLSDLSKAEADLHHVIAELDELTKTEFMRTFSSVAEEFHDIFHRLFGGGSARLVLTDPENLTETGIDIEARLPGRREQGLSLLSGGERSLTAIALVFALLKVSPTPVCVMDEVDAMLDEANVGRFRDLLLDLSRATQFVIVTHNRNTVQAADVIYGVTMGRDSTSQVISLKLDEISDEYLK